MKKRFIFFNLILYISMGINYLALAQQYSINKDQIQTLVSQAVSQVERKVTLDMVFDTYKVES